MVVDPAGNATSHQNTPVIANRDACDFSMLSAGIYEIIHAHDQTAGEVSYQKASKALLMS